MTTVAGFEVLDVDDVDRSGPPPAKDVLEWARAYLATRGAEPELGRSLVCPFIPRSLRNGSLRFVVASGVADPAGTERVVRAAADRYVELAPLVGPETRYKSLVCIFPEVCPADAVACIDDVQSRLKHEFVTTRLLMIGEMHEHNRSASKVNPQLFPNRSPVPLLALRPIVAEDYPKFFEGCTASEAAEYRSAWSSAQDLSADRV